MTRYPLHDLTRLIRFTPDELDAIGEIKLGRDNLPSLRPSDNKIRERLAVSATAWRRYKTEGLTFDQADRLATRAGFHPANVWTDWAREAS